MILRPDPQFAYARNAIAASIRAACRPAVRLAALLACFVLVCCITRSDAKIAGPVMLSFDNVQVVGSWSKANDGDGSTNVPTMQTSAVVASAQSMLTTTKFDDADATPGHVTTLRVDTKIHARRIAFAAPPVIRFTPYLAPGHVRMQRNGTPGAAWVTERITLWNDVVVSRQTLSRQVVHEARPGVELIGTPKTLAQLRRVMPRQAFAAMTMVATAYTADSASAYPTGYTATGILARQGVVAVDPRVIPLGTTLFVPGYGVAIAADTGGAIIGNRIDLCMDSYGEAIEFGRRTVQVYVMKR